MPAAAAARPPGRLRTAGPERRGGLGIRKSTLAAAASPNARPARESPRGPSSHRKAAVAAQAQKKNVSGWPPAKTSRSARVVSPAARRFASRARRRAPRSRSGRLAIEIPSA